MLELQAEIERWGSCVSHNEKKLKDKLDDETKLAGLDALLLEELEKHLILNSNRLRTFEDARLEIVTYVEAKFKFGLRIRDSKPSDTGSRGHSDPMEVDAVNSLSSSKGKITFQRDCNARKCTGKQSFGKGKQSNSWSKSDGKGKSKESKGRKSKGKSKGLDKVTTSKTGPSDLKNSKSETSSETQEVARTYPTDNSYANNSWCDDERSYDEWNDDWSSV